MHFERSRSEKLLTWWIASFQNIVPKFHDLEKDLVQEIRANK